MFCCTWSYYEQKVSGIFYSNVPRTVREIVAKRKFFFTNTKHLLCYHWKMKSDKPFGKISRLWSYRSAITKYLTFILVDCSRGENADIRVALPKSSIIGKLTSLWKLRDATNTNYQNRKKALNLSTMSPR